MRISDWSSDVCSSDLLDRGRSWSASAFHDPVQWALGVLDLTAVDDVQVPDRAVVQSRFRDMLRIAHPDHGGATDDAAKRSEEHTSELQSLMRISNDVICLKKKTHIRIIK